MTAVRYKMGTEKGKSTTPFEYAEVLGQIQAIENALTRVQASKQRTIDSLHRYGYDDARLKLELKKYDSSDDEIPDAKFIKSLIDNYDKSHSDVSNTLEEVRYVIFGLKGYGGQSLAEFMRDLIYYRAVSLDEDGDLETYNPTIDIADSEVNSS